MSKCDAIYYTQYAILEKEEKGEENSVSSDDDLWIGD